VKPLRRRVAASIAVLALLGQVPAPVAAQHVGRPIGSFSNCQRPVTPPRCSSVGNDTRHHVVFDATLTIGLAESLRDTMFEDYDPTKLEMILQDAVTPETDVIAFSQDYGNNGAAGWVYCPPSAPQGINRQRHRWCQQQELHFNLNASMAAFFADDGSRDHVACHELGHTLGLRHWGNPPQSAAPEAATCMNANTPDGPPNLHLVDMEHIDLYRYSSLPPARNLQPMDIKPDGDRRLLITGWADVAADALELERFDSLLAMTAGSDAVVVGRIVDVTGGRSMGGASGHPLHYAAVTVEVDELVSGSLPTRHAQRLTLEVPLFGGLETLDAARSSLPREESLFFLRNKGGPERSFYRLVVMDGVIVNGGGTAEVPAEVEGFMADLGGARFDRLVDEIRLSAP
jgi:hypothetical protein